MLAELGSIHNRLSRPIAPRFFRPLGFCLFLLISADLMWAQSTYSTLVGTVKDRTGAVLPGATVMITNVGTTAVRTILTAEAGDYSAPNLEVGTYEVAIELSGFRRSVFKDVTLLARQAVRLDAQLDLSQLADEVTVTASNVLTTETPTISMTKTGDELIELPVTISAHASGSTSPLSTLTAQPGVQTDNEGKLSIAGGQPFMTTITIDGISSAGIRTAGPLTELFPSMHAIAEIRVSQVNNNAEFAQAGDITTVSKSGTNEYHGAVFWNHQNAALDARNPLSSTKPAKVMHNFGTDFSDRSRFRATTAIIAPSSLPVMKASAWPSSPFKFKACRRWPSATATSPACCPTSKSITRSPGRLTRTTRFP
jgi:hypothetical protein